MHRSGLARGCPRRDALSRSLGMICCALSLLAAGLAWAASGGWSGTVLAVPDGDTLEIQRGQQRLTVHLAGVDAPRPDQPFGQQARAFVQGLAQGQLVNVEPCEAGEGFAQRGQVILPDGRDLGLELLKEGLAWRDRGSRDDPFLRELESNACQERLGLWAGNDPVPP